MASRRAYKCRDAAALRRFVTVYLVCSVSFGGLTEGHALKQSRSLAASPAPSSSPGYVRHCYGMVLVWYCSGRGQRARSEVMAKEVCDRARAEHGDTATNTVRNTLFARSSCHRKVVTR